MSTLESVALWTLHAVLLAQVCTIQIPLPLPVLNVPTGGLLLHQHSPLRVMADCCVCSVAHRMLCQQVVFSGQHGVAGSDPDHPPQSASTAASAAYLGIVVWGACHHHTHSWGVMELS